MRDGSFFFYDARVTRMFHTIGDAFAHAPRALRWLSALVCAALLSSLHQLTLLEARDARAEECVVESVETLYVPDIRTTQLLFLGYRQTAADVVWLRALDYFAGHFNGDHRYHWLVYFIDQIVELDPRFRRVYQWAGATVLYGQQFTNENVRLSNRFYEADLKQFPDDYEAAFRLGMNYYVEMHASDPAERRKFQEIGAQYLEQAANMPGATDQIRNLVASIYTKLGSTELAVQSLLLMLQTTENPRQRDNILARLEKVRGRTDTLELARGLENSERQRHTFFDYLPAALFVLVDGGGKGTATGGIPDRSWRELIPDVSVGDLPPTLEEP